jgi:type I restriction enzyme S subunit
MIPEQLKLSILQSAFQGKLTGECVPNETADDLYQQIQSEKQRLISEKKIKKEKPLPEISADEIPFDIPDNWRWCYVGDLFLHNTGKAQNSSGSTNGTIRKFITTSNLYWDRFDFTKIKEMPFTEAELERCTVRKGDLLVCEGGDCGRSAVWNYDEEVCIQNHVHRLRPYQDVNIYYFYYLFYLYKNTGRLRGRGVAIQGLSNEAIHKIIVPLAPLAEQKRIVAKIEDLLPYIDRYAASYERLEQVNTEFPEDMKKSVLQYAIQGKLVEQRAEEGTGEELYRQIQAEKKRLIKEGKIKKEKPLPEIAEDEIPFDIPESWRWVRFSEIMSTMSTGPFGSMLHKTDYIEKGIPLVNPANMVNGKIVPSDKMMISEATRRRLSSYILHAGMIVLGRRGEMGRCAVVTEKEDGWLCGTGSFFMEPSMSLYVYYVVSLFSSPYVKFYLGGESVGTTMSNLNHTILSKMPIPLPPLAEQRRIVAKLDEILPLCEKLK